MRKLLLLLASTLLMAGCAESFEPAEPSTAIRADVSQSASGLHTRSLDGAVFNEIVDAWMVPQPDPYTLANFQQAYDNLAASKSTRPLTKALAAEFTASRKLEPTHYALKIYPRNEDEQWSVERMEDVQVSYHPFDYSMLTEQETKKLPQSKTRSAANTFTEKSPYTVTYEDMESTAGGPVEPRTFQLPILYTVWPVEKPLPDNLEYVVDYEVFLPRASSLGKEATQILGGEAHALAHGATTRAAASTQVLYPCQILGDMTTWDDQIESYVSLGNLRLRYEDGANIVYLSYYPDGSFEGYVDVAQEHMMYFTPFDLSLTFYYQDPASFRWKITIGNSTNAYSSSVGITFQPLLSEGQAEGNAVLTTSAYQLNEIQRAAAKFFSQTDFPRTSLPYNIKIVASNAMKPSSPGIRGEFVYPASVDNYDPWINIYNLETKHPVTIGATLHEFGHALHYWDNRSAVGNANNFRNTELLLSESYANYVGWELGETLYESMGWIRPIGLITTQEHRNLAEIDITMNARQKWTWQSGVYSPLFVDMADPIYQSSYIGGIPSYLHDPFEGVTSAQIRSIINSSTTWASCKSQLQTILLSKGYTQSELYNYFNDYELWFLFNQ